MTRTLHLTIACLLLLPFSSSGQELSYLHYTPRDGLAGTTVYSMTFDKEGFLWLGTDAGLSRFDGTYFRNFTSRDGLEDNEVLAVFTDSRGRVWTSTFVPSACYYYRGKIYSRKNDRQLAQLRLHNNIIGFHEDSAHNIFVHESDQIHVIKPNGSVELIRTINGRPFNRCAMINTDARGHVWVVEQDTLYNYVNGHFKVCKKLRFPAYHPTYIAQRDSFIVHRSAFDVMVAENIYTGKIQASKFPKTTIKMSFLSDGRACVNTSAGTRISDPHRFSDAVEYLGKKPVSVTILDPEGNLWLGTMGDGLYRLTSDFMYNLTLLGQKKEVLSVQALMRYDHRLLIGTNLNYRFLANIATASARRVMTNTPVNATVRFFAVIDSTKDILTGGDISVWRFTHDFSPRDMLRYVAAKCVARLGNDRFVVGTTTNAFIYDPFGRTENDTIWRSRCTAVAFKKDTFYIGTTTGAYALVPHRTQINLSNRCSEMQSRIADIQQGADGTLWFATYNNGVVGYKDGHTTAHFTTDDGLTSNICRTIFAEGKNLWVGTEKGINKIALEGPGARVTRYTTVDGLASDIINVLYVSHDTVYAGTPVGLTYFNEKNISFRSRCDLRVTGITVGGQAYPADSNHFSLSHGNDNIRISFAGISFRSAGDIAYRYRLLGLDSMWRSTTETSLNYPRLPSGSYMLQLQATNKFGITSDMITLEFSVKKRLWEENWFMLFVFLAGLAILWRLISYRVAQVRRQGEQKAGIEKRINDLEQLALRSQMNPHFIFNSLNSIQQYVMDKDVEGANRFITGFSRLIRKTLEFSSKQFVNLADEIDYLSTYLELEKVRLENKFRYETLVDDHMNLHEYQVPPMILQPYVENSVRHGVRYRKDSDGLITIRFFLDKDRLVCVIEDNGIGRVMSARFKSANPIEYQSRGMSLTADRMEMLNRIGYEIDVQIDDKYDDAGQSAGTRVTVHFSATT